MTAAIVKGGCKIELKILLYHAQQSDNRISNLIPQAMRLQQSCSSELLVLETISSVVQQFALGC
jgi:hypothetical protein